MGGGITEDWAAFPPTISSPFGGELALRYRLPRVHCRPSRPFAIYWSDDQGFGQLFPLPDDAELEGFYSSEEYDHYLAGAAGMKRAVARPLLRRLVDGVVFRVASRVSEGVTTTAASVHGLIGKPSDICDVGCGSGLMLQELARHGHRVVGVEPNRIAREHGNKQGIEIVAGSGEELSGLGVRQFDVLTMVQSLEHTRDPFSTLANCVRHMKRGGILWVEVPNHGSRGYRDRGPIWFHTDAGRHMQFFTASSLRRAMEGVGLQHVATHYSGYLRQFTWLEAEQAVWRALYSAAADPAALSAPALPQPWTLLRHLWRTLFSSAERRHDSVSVLARKA